MPGTMPRGSRLTGIVRYKKFAVDTSTLLLGLVFSAIGAGFFMYGRKQQRPVPLVCGLVLMVYPYFVSSNALLVAIGLALIATPYFWHT